MSLFEDFFLPPGFEEEAEFMPLFSVDEDNENRKQDNIPNALPILALKNTVLFPGIVIPITVGRDKSIKAINKAYEEGRIIAVLSQRDSSVEDPHTSDLYQVGTIARILKLLKMPDGTATAILQGKHRFELQQINQFDPYLFGEIQLLDEQKPEEKLAFEALISTIKDMAKQIIQLSPNIPSEAIVMLKNINQDFFLLNFIASNLGIKVEAKQLILEIDSIKERAETILEYMDGELRLLELKDQIETKVRGDIEKQQRDYYLSQQLKTIQEELGQNPQEEELRKLQERAQKKKWSKEVEKSFLKDLSKVRRMNPQVAEFSVMMNYLELMLDLPWGEFTKDNFNLKKVKQVLDKDHYGLEKVKNRILEHLAVLKLKGDMKAPILCLVGPPGVGKTSLGKSIASALKRKFIMQAPQRHANKFSFQ
ncbi:MAG: LON peptidase substrate-binding domain-containing protein, partial [Bacteroidota bacterium]